MSLMRFLVVGSSLRGVKDRPCPYKMTQQHLLPKFGPGKPAEAKSVVPLSSAKEPGGSAGARLENEGTQMTLVEAEDKQQPAGGVRPSPGAANCEGSSMSDLSQ